MISRQSNEVNDDFKLLGKELENSGMKVVYLCRTLDGGVNSTLFTKVMYGFHMFTQMYHLATSKVCVLDTYCLVVSILKHKKALQVVQIWHTVGKLKQFGWQIIGKGEGSSETIATVMKMHENYDVIYCAGEEYKQVLMEGFRAPAEKFRIFTLPRIDLLTDENYINSTREKIFAKYPVLKEKPNVVYAPTFRKKEDEFEKYLKEFINAFNFEKYNLIVKLHPLSKTVVADERVIMDNEFSTFQMFTCTDKLVSDYSCVVYEAGIKGIPLYFYNYDMNTYENVRGLAIDYNVLPGYKEQNAKKLVESFEKPYDYEYLNSYIRLHIENIKDCTRKMAADIISLSHNQSS
ncbi:MAG: CDP-glycerol glycerophosphotransferase family protein [Clostridia bacterium]|nr:CDP-glycerol glycerophosphotransferase family protein [Clostridia bacterium]